MTAISERAAPLARPARRFSRSWLGLGPVFLFAIFFIGAPVTYLVLGSFQNNEGQTTLQNYADLATPSIANAFLITVEVSLVTAVVGGIFGFLLAYAFPHCCLPPAIFNSFLSFTVVA